MTVVLLGNPRSGRGLAKRLRARFARALGAVGRAVRMLDVDPDQPGGIVNGGLDGAEALVVFGGDGTIHHTAAAAVRTGTCIYHVPAGTENLFARAFGMTRRPGDLIAALARREVQRVDVARWNDRMFLIMASTGPDAGIIRRLNRARSWTVGHAAYVAPTLAEMLKPSIAVVTVRVDGRPVVESRRGTLIIANSREYAARLNFARAGDMRDGVLDVVFLPHATAGGAVVWAVRGWAEAFFPGVLRRGGAVVGRGVRVEVVTSDGAPWQVDGELASRGAASALLTLQPGALPVLVPSS